MDTDRHAAEVEAAAGPRAGVPRRRAVWSDRNLSALRTLATILLICVAFRAAARPLRIDDDGCVRFAAAATVPPVSETIDPETAAWPSLARLPGIGPVKAKAICEYRDRRRAAGAAGRIFTCAGDLEKVYGIGPQTAGRIAPYLSFPPPEARP